MLDRLRVRGLYAAGLVGDPDPYTAIMNALQYFRVDDIVISTFAETKSGWLRSDLVERVRRVSGKPVEHIVHAGDDRSGRLMEAASIAQAHADHHGPPPAHRSSRAEPATLGMLLFIISEVMIFGAFFTAYFFIRVVNHDPWPAHGTLLPEAVAGINTAILLSSSLTLHWALVSTRKGNRWGMKVGMLTTFLLGSGLPDHSDQRVRPHRVRPA